jgi:hypothetical protein
MLKYPNRFLLYLVDLSRDRRRRHHSRNLPSASSVLPPSAVAPPSLAGFQLLPRLPLLPSSDRPRCSPPAWPRPCRQTLSSVDLVPGQSRPSPLHPVSRSALWLSTARPHPDRAWPGLVCLCELSGVQNYGLGNSEFVPYCSHMVRCMYFK